MKKKRYFPIRRGKTWVYILKNIGRPRTRTRGGLNGGPKDLHPKSQKEKKKGEGEVPKGLTSLGGGGERGKGAAVPKEGF